jgi:hypothetical protein
MGVEPLPETARLAVFCGICSRVIVLRDERLLEKYYYNVINFNSQSALSVKKQLEAAYFFYPLVKEKLRFNH